MQEYFRKKWCFICYIERIYYIVFGKECFLLFLNKIKYFNFKFCRVFVLEEVLFIDEGFSLDNDFDFEEMGKNLESMLFNKKISFQVRVLLMVLYMQIKLYRAYRFFVCNYIQMYGKECDYIMLMFCLQLFYEKEEAERREFQKMLMGDDGKDKGDKFSKFKFKDDDFGFVV